jgi:hypothetical protein
VELIQEIGSYAGFAAVVGLAVLSALYFSQARDVKRLREWAGRAPERAAEIEAGGRAAAAVPVAARPQPQVRAPGEAAAAGGAAPAAAPAAAAATGAAPATAAAPAAATAGTAGSNGSEEGVTDQDADADLDDDAELDAEEREEETSVAPAAATPAGAVASGADTAERPPAPGDTGTGVKVLPPRRPAPPVRPRPTIPPRTNPPRPAPSVLGQAPGSRPPQRGGRSWPAPRYIALIIGAIVILGLAGTVGVLQLTKEDEPQEQTAAEPAPDPNVAPDEPDRPEPARVNPADVKVAVLNATATNGLATRVASRLEADGFVTGNVTNAAERQRAESVVMFKPGRNGEARTVTRSLDIGQIEPIDQASEALAGDAMVVVVLGADKTQE